MSSSNIVYTTLAFFFNDDTLYLCVCVMDVHSDNRSCVMKAKITRLFREAAAAHGPVFFIAAGTFFFGVVL